MTPPDFLVLPALRRRRRAISNQLAADLAKAVTRNEGLEARVLHLDAENERIAMLAAGTFKANQRAFRQIENLAALAMHLGATREDVMCCEPREVEL